MDYEKRSLTAAEARGIAGAKVHGEISIAIFMALFHMGLWKPTTKVGEPETRVIETPNKGSVLIVTRQPDGSTTSSRH